MGLRCRLDRDRRRRLQRDTRGRGLFGGFGLREAAYAETLRRVRMRLLELRARLTS